ncbi:hypothetical protein Efla_004852 [Eimeria flavescens]
MDWHGLYQNLLFSHDPLTHPCNTSNIDDPAGTSAADTQTAGLQENVHLLGHPCTAGEDSPSNATAAESMRGRGCKSIPHIFATLGEKAEEFVAFLQDFEEGEDDESVLMALCNGLKEFFETMGASKHGLGKGCGSLLAKALNGIPNLLLRILIHRDREIKLAAISAFQALLAATDGTLILQTDLISQVLELSDDQRDAFRQAAAMLLPAALQTGQHLSTFVDCIAEEVDALQNEQMLQQKRFGEAVDKAALSDDKAEELMLALYTATHKFTVSPNECCRMRGVSAIAAMARTNAAAFRALGNNFFPMLCSDSSWRVRAATCLALDDLALLSTDSVMMETDGTQIRGDATDAESRIPSLLFKFLTDRSPMVKMAALQQLQRSAKLLGTASFVHDSWLLELQQIGEDEGNTAASRLPGACLDAVVSILELAEGHQRRSLLELAMNLAQRGNWRMKFTFLRAARMLQQDELAFISPFILSESFAWDEDGDDYWRIQAAVAQQLPVFIGAKFREEEEEGWWRRCETLLLHPAWAVRQEAGSALREILQHASREGQEESVLDALMEQRLQRALQEVASCNNAFIRQDLAFYLHQIWDVVPFSRLKLLAAPLLQLMLRDKAPCCRLALAKLLRQVCSRNWTANFEFRDDLKLMLERLSVDEAPGVREEALASSPDCTEQLQTQAVR